MYNVSQGHVWQLPAYLRPGCNKSRSRWRLYLLLQGQGKYKLKPCWAAMPDYPADAGMSCTRKGYVWPLCLLIRSWDVHYEPGHVVWRLRPLLWSWDVKSEPIPWWLLYMLILEWDVESKACTAAMPAPKTHQLWFGMRKQLAPYETPVRLWFQIALRTILFSNRTAYDRILITALCQLFVLSWSSTTPAERGLPITLNFEANLGQLYHHDRMMEQSVPVKL